MVLDADDGLGMRGISTGGGTPVGVAVDSLGYIWAVNQDTNHATRPLRATSVTPPAIRFSSMLRWTAWAIRSSRTLHLG